MQLSARVRDLMESGVNDSDEIAEKLLPEILAMDGAFDVLFPLIRSHVEVTRRALVRAIENQAWYNREDAPDDAEVSQNPAMRGRPDFSGLMTQMVTIRIAGQPTREVPWGRMTVEDHADRIRMLETLINGNVQTIRRHEEAIRIIRLDNATCLAECRF